MSVLPQPSPLTTGGTDCDRDPIHLPGAIQPHGALLAADPVTRAVLLASANAPAWLGADPADLYGRPMDRWFVADDLRRLEADLAAGSRAQELLRTAGAAPVTFEATARRVDGLLVLELEPASAGPAPSWPGVYATLVRLEALTDRDRLFAEVLAEVRRLTGFDRALVYQFDPDGHGAVIAEDRAAGMEGFLGHRFPAGDVPAPARRLYTLNPIRLIPDARYEPIPLVPTLHPHTGRPFDLSEVDLRSVAPVHLEYLANMGVRASLSLSLVVAGRLWGLIACHHRPPRHVPAAARNGCMLVARLLAARLQDLEATAVAVRRADQAARLLRLTEHLAQGDFLGADLGAGGADLMGLAGAAGAAVCSPRGVAVVGRTPAPEQIRELVAWLAQAHPDGAFHTPCLADAYPPAEAFLDRAAGLLAVTVARHPAIHVLWFRPEQIHEVCWAGDPSKGPADAPLRPRTSFATWREIVRRRAVAWDDLDVAAARRLPEVLVDTILRQAEARAQLVERLRESEQFLATILDVLPAPLAVLDDGGRLVAVNAAWRDGAGAGQFAPAGGPGDDFLAACEALGETVPEAVGVAARLREILDGWRPAFAWPFARRGTAGGWFTLRARALPPGAPARVVIVLEDITDVVVLQDLNRLSTQALEAANEAVVIADFRAEGWPVIFVNPAFTRITGYTAAEILGRNCRILQGPRTDPAAVAAIRAALAACRPVTVEVTNYRKDGTPFENALSLAPVRDAAGAVTHYVGIMNDVTDRKGAEAEQQRIHDLLRAVLEGTPDAVFVKDRQGRYLLANAATARFVGKPVAEMLGKDDTALFDAASAALLLDNDRQVMATGRAEVHEEAITAAGVTRTFLATKAPYRDEQGNVLGVIGISRDISERKAAEEALRRQQELSQAIFDHIPALLCRYDDQGRFLFVNRAYEQTLGWTLADVRAGVDLMAVTNDDARVRAEAARHMSDPTGAWRDFPHRTRNGRRVFIAWANVRLSDGTWVGIGQDVTERKKVEDTRRWLFGLTLQAQEAERARIARDLHDGIGQALTSLLIGLRLTPGAGGAAPATDLRALAAGALDEVRRLARGLRPRALDDLGFLAALDRLVADYTQVHGLTVATDLGGAAPQDRLPADVETALYRITQEALTNVARHAAADHVTITFRRDRGAVRLTVADNGRGFDPAAVGAGQASFGLAGMRERAHLLGGAVEILSRPGAGTRIQIHLPIPETPA